MKTKCILISGSSISKDVQLAHELERIADVLKCSENSEIEKILEKSRIDLILFEIENYKKYKIEIIKKVEHLYPNIKIILITSNRDSIANGFESGADDAFRMPYKRELIVERVAAILRSN